MTDEENVLGHGIDDKTAAYYGEQRKHIETALNRAHNWTAQATVQSSDRIDSWRFEDAFDHFLMRHYPAVREYIEANAPEDTTQSTDTTDENHSLSEFHPA